ncbi:MAG: hypothetical protein ACRCS6_06795 [Turicibacter sp.]
MKKKLLSSILAVSVLSLGLAGCGSKNSAGTADLDVAMDEIKEIETTGKNVYGWDVPKETMDLTYYQKGMIDPKDNEKNMKMMQDYLLDNFNINVEKLVYNTDALERFNLAMASSDYPEMISGLKKEDVLQMKSQGKLVDLTAYMDEYGQNLKKALGDKYNRYLDADGKLFYLPAGWGMLPIPDYSAHIKYSTWVELGSPTSIPVDQYYQILKDDITKNPTNEDGQKRYALSWHDSLKIETVAGFWGLQQGYLEDSENNLTHWVNTQQGYDFTKFYNQAYQDGLFDPDGFTNKFDDWKAKFSTRRVAGHIGGWWEGWNAGHEVWHKTDPNWQEEDKYIQVNLQVPGVEKSYLSPKNTTAGSYTVVTNKVESPEKIVQIIKFLDLMASDNMTRLMGWGVPNGADSNWNIEEDGSWSFNEKSKQDSINAEYNYELHDTYGPQIIWLAHGVEEMSDLPNGCSWFDQSLRFENPWLKILNDNLSDTVYDASALIDIDFLPTDDATVIKQQVNDIVKSYWAKAVLSNTPEEFESNFNELKTKANQAGVEKLEAFMTEKYNQNLINWGMKK